MQKIAQGAEAVLYLDNNVIIKERISKAYRLSEIDVSLRRFRTRREAKVLEKLKEINFPAPRLLEISDKKMILNMDFIPGLKIRDAINENNYSQLAYEIGKKIGLLHSQNIIHGDLTTSNMIFHSDTKEIYFIDFGLSFFSEKFEDKAVDLNLLDRAFESKHYLLYPNVFNSALEGYKDVYPDAETILGRFEVVRSRGRNKK